MYLLKNKNTPLFALIFRLFGFASGVVALTLQAVVNLTVSEEFLVNHSLAYFTVQTNIFTTAIFLYLIIKTVVLSKRARKLVLVHINPKVNLAFTLYITITLLGFWLALAPITGFGFAPVTVCLNLFIHTFTPLFAIFDSLLFMPHGEIKIKDAPKWLVYPVLYLISILAIAPMLDTPYYKVKINGESIGLKYPYPFIDPQVVGIFGMILAIIILFIIFTLLSVLFIYIDNKLALFISKRTAEKQ